MQLSPKIKTTIGKYLSKIVNYREIKIISQLTIGLANITGIHKFDIYGKIPDKPATLGMRHKFFINGCSFDVYILAAASPRKIHGFVHPDQFKKPFYRPFLEAWELIPAEKKYLRNLESEAYKEDSLGISVEGPSDQSQKDNNEGYRTAAFIAKYHNPLIPIRLEVKKGPWGGFLGGSTKLEARPEIYIPREAKKEDLTELTKRLMKELE